MSLRCSRPNWQTPTSPSEGLANFPRLLPKVLHPSLHVRCGCHLAGLAWPSEDGPEDDPRSACFGVEWFYMVTVVPGYNMFTKKRT